LLSGVLSCHWCSFRLVIGMQKEPTCKLKIGE
jgi:hypothetical protein